MTQQLSHRVLACSLISVCLASGCDQQQRQSDQTVERPGQPPVADVEDDDPQMLAAIGKARETVDTFVAALQNPQPSQSSFSVKMPITDGPNTEHMWILPVRLENDQFVGQLNNEPDALQGKKLGDTVRVAKDKISDWMFTENRRLVGGYTLRVLRSNMSAAERAEFDKTVDFAVD